MIQTVTAQHPALSPTFQFGRRLKYLFCICLVISIMLHVVTIIGVIATSSAPRSGAAVSYIDIDDFTAPPTKRISTFRSPVQEPGKLEPVQLPSTDTNKSVTNNDSDSTAIANSEVMSSPLGLGMTNGYFSSLADGRTLREDIRGYYFVILERINQRWWQNAGTLKETALQDGIISINIDREGNLLDMRQMRSTGSREVDRAIIDTITGTAPFPPLPASYEQGTFQSPIKITKPSHLFSKRSS